MTFTTSVWFPQRIEELRSLAAEGLTAKEIARRMGMTPAAVAVAMSKHGIRSTWRKWTPGMMLVVEQVAESGMSRKAAAKGLGTSPMCLDAACKRNFGKTYMQLVKEFEDESQEQ